MNIPAGYCSTTLRGGRFDPAATISQYSKIAGSEANFSRCAKVVFRYLDTVYALLQPTMDFPGGLPKAVTALYSKPEMDMPAKLTGSMRSIRLKKMTALNQLWAKAAQNHEHQQQQARHKPRQNGDDSAFRPGRFLRQIGSAENYVARHTLQ